MKKPDVERKIAAENESPPTETTRAQTPPAAAKTASSVSVSGKDDVELIMKSIGERYRETRAMTVDFHKTVVVNVLFPILTALLGYIFANRERNEPNQGGK